LNKLEEAIFHAASELDDAQARAAFLDRTCGADPALRARIETLLQADVRARQFLSEDPLELGTSAAHGNPPPTEAPGNVIGRYKLLQKIGEGGFGVVFMAEQQEPVRRRVALKIIKLGMDTKQVVARFEAERQALALMDHPNIARVLDGGATETGRPYFVMELVQGVPITEFCDKNQFSAEQRLKLFIPVCEAIQSAHQKGIIHRDLKPTNILVTLNPDGSGFPKVIDFGVAKATSQQLTEKTLFTAHGMMVGTPAYMSPEQAEMSHLDVDTRADIYSLGALLYELLTGSTPFPEQRLRSAGYNEMQRIILQEEPERPSTRLSTLQGEQRSVIARNRGASELTLGRAFPGDLDWIVMKCLEKDRARRYETANGLARDLALHLRHEPVTARPPSRLYEFQKTMRRHRVSFAAVSAVVGALSLGLVVSGLEAARARRAERLARQARTDESNQKKAAQQLLYKSLVGEAHATRLARRVGYRDQVFNLLEQAKALEVPGKNLEDLRQEAVACLGDFVGLSPVSFSNFATNVTFACLEPSGKMAAFGLSSGKVEIRDVPSGKVKANLACADSIWGCRFKTRGDQLNAVAGPYIDSVSTNGWVDDQARVLTNRWIYTWKCDAEGHWWEAGKRAVPGATRSLIEDETGVLDVVLEVGPQGSGGETNHLLKFSLLNLETGTLVPGCKVITTVPRYLPFQFSAISGGRFLAVAKRENQRADASVVVNVFSWRTGDLTDQLRLPACGRLDSSDDGKYLCCVSVGGTAIYGLPGFELIGRFKEYSGSPVVFSRNGEVALPLSFQNRIRLWSLGAHEDITLLDDSEAPAPVAFSSDGGRLLSVGARNARLYSMNTTETLELTPHAGAVTGLSFSPDGRTVASAGQDRVLRVHDATTGRVLWQTSGLPGPAQTVDFSPDGRWLVSAGISPLVWIFDVQTGKRVLELGADRLPRLGSFQTTVRFSPDGHYLAEARGPNGGIQIWAIDKSEAGENPGLQAKPFKSWAHGLFLVFAPDGRSVAFDANSKGQFNLYLWEFDRSPEPRQMASGIRLGCPAFTPNGGRLLLMDTNGTIITLDARTGERVSSFQAELSAPPQEARANSLQLSPDGLKVARQSVSGFGVNVWEQATGHVLYHLGPEVGKVYCLAWSPDSHRLAIGRDNGSLVLWDLAQVDTKLAELGLKP
jgi:serine/threonine protein kinase/WD40 repeat protein